MGGGIGSALGAYGAIQGNKRIEEAMAGARLESERLKRRVLGQDADVKLAREKQAARDVGTLRASGIGGRALLGDVAFKLAQQGLLDRRATEGQLAAIESRYGAISQRYESQVVNPWMAAVRGGAEGAMIGSGFKKA